MFVWQVAVHERARGRGLGVAMLNALFQFPAVFDAVRLVTTVTPSNRGSRKMFANFARQQGLDLEIRPCFDRERHLGGAHESEELISIDPLDTARLRSDEHTSELQPIMRITYAVFCLTQKKKSHNS